MYTKLKPTVFQICVDSESFDIRCLVSKFLMIYWSNDARVLPHARPVQYKSCSVHRTRCVKVGNYHWIKCQRKRNQGVPPFCTGSCMPFCPGPCVVHYSKSSPVSKFHSYKGKATVNKNNFHMKGFALEPICFYMHRNKHSIDLRNVTFTTVRS